MEQNNAALGTVAYMTVGFVVLGVLACAGFFIGLVVPCGKQVAGGAAGKSTKSISKAEQITCVSLGAARCLRSLLRPPRTRIYCKCFAQQRRAPHLLTHPHAAPRFASPSTSPSRSVMFVLVSIGIFMMWTLWLTAWLHQWHPLMVPLKE